MSKAGSRYLGTFYPVPVRRLIGSTLLLISLLCVSAAAQAQPERSTRSWYLQVGAYTHYGDKEEYEGPPLFAGIEHHNKNRTIIGYSMFNNSFGDFSQYLYLGKAFHPLEKYPWLRIKLTIGIVHGYKDKNQEILPIRWGEASGIGVVPTIGYQKGRVGFDLGILSASGLLFLVGYKF
jgi:hypothetical protein